MSDNYDEMSTSDLRGLVRSQGIGGGAVVSEMSAWLAKAVLRGEITWGQVIDAKNAHGSVNDKSFYGLPEPTPEPTPVKPAPAPVNGNAALAQIAAGLAALVPSQGLDEKRVSEIATAAAQAVVKDVVAPVRVVVEDRKTATTKDCGVVHKQFATLLALCQAREANGMVPPIYLYGPAGTGKTTAAAKVAEALGLPFYFNGAINCAYELSGFIDAGGRYQETPFYKAYSGGGVYLFDELDSSMPGAVLAFNAALANGHAAFPVGNVKRHENCIILAAGNTCMRGDGNAQGFQRMKMDAAFRDRFVFLEWGIDDALEASIAASYGDEKFGWLADVRRWRANAEAHGVKDFEITPRATVRGLALLNAGVPREVVVDATVRKGLSEQVWAQVKW